MGRLFWKFFFVFWLTVITAGLVVGGVVWLHRQVEHERDPYVAVGGPPAFITKTAATVLDTTGVAGLRALLEQWQEPFEIYAVDDADHDLLGRSVAQPMIAAARALAQRQEPRTAMNCPPRSGSTMGMPLSMSIVVVTRKKIRSLIRTGTYPLLRKR